ncbi:hypothetical protein AC322_18630 [Salmonella enterica subsp. salamae]|nr:hypothetical protein [Salmonella enterica subsp. salamae]EGW3960816.1 hypothetical protein [Salmonella enterica subsp. enterica serovar Enteritidis]
MFFRVNDFWVLFFGDSMAFFDCKDAAVNGLSRYADRLIYQTRQNCQQVADELKKRHPHYEFSCGEVYRGEEG